MALYQCSIRARCSSGTNNTDLDVDAIGVVGINKARRKSLVAGSKDLRPSIYRISNLGVGYSYSAFGLCNSWFLLRLWLRLAEFFPAN